MVPIKPIGGGVAGETWRDGNSMRIGIQDQGSSTDPVYRLAERMICSWDLPYTSMVLDLGGGAGHFAETLTNYFEHVHLMDFSPIIHSKRIIYSSGNLNELLPYSDATFDAVVSLEVIEHLENPRHFVREISRILKVNGRCLITTPNQISLSSKLCLLLRGQFQHFQDNSYPAHITALLPIDLKRITAEAGLAFKAIGSCNEKGSNARLRPTPLAAPTASRVTSSTKRARTFRNLHWLLVPKL